MQTKQQVDSSRAVVSVAWKSMQRIFCKTLNFFKQKDKQLGEIWATLILLALYVCLVMPSLSIYKNTLLSKIT